MSNLKSTVFFFILSLAFLSSIELKAYNLYGEDPVRGLYENDGAIVSVPANFGASVFQLGCLSAGVPVIGVGSLLYAPFSRHPFTTNFNRGMAEYNFFIDRYARQVAYYPVGLPFYVLKKVVWDGPKYVIFGLFDWQDAEEKNNEAINEWEEEANSTYWKKHKLKPSSQSD